MIQPVLRRIVKWAYSNDKSFVHYWRQKRMKSFLELVRPPSGARIIDLGGAEHLWTLFEHDFRITIVNLPDREEWKSQVENVTLVEADACNLKDLFQDQQFDVAFSNSVIEHVGDLERIEQFSQEVRRLALSYWVQTPSHRFPIEPHSGLPFYWQLPDFIKTSLHRQWKKKMPWFDEMMSNTTYLPREQMEALFPEGKMHIERQFGFEKSFCLYKSYKDAC